MGRHSASYIAAQQGQSTGPTHAGAAKYVGGVGAVALSLWAGAAIAASGVANADDAGTAPDSAGTVKTALHSLTGALRHGLTDGAATDGVKLPKLGLPTKPKSSDDGGNVLTGPLRTLSDRVPHQLASKDPAAKPNSQRTDLTNGGLTAAGPVVSAVSNALRKPVEVATDSVDTTPPATVTSFAPSVTRQLAPASLPAVSTGLLTALGDNPLNNGGGLPVVPAASNLLGALQLVRRDTELTSLAQPLSLPTIGSLLHPAPPAPPTYLDNYPDGVTDTTNVPPAANQTTYVPGVGEVGKWMLKSDGSVSNYGGQTYDGGKEMLEPVNVIIVDPTSKSPAEAQAKLNKAMFLSGFPAQPIHSGGFKGLIGTSTYGQKPIVPLTAYSDNLFILDNDHGRIFGPAPLPGPDGGYVWTGAFSSETLGVSENGIPGHTYVSSNAARDALVLRMIASGQVESVTYVPMDNAYDPDNPDYTTGDHDGYAVVITLK